jgi:hypothetical protein
MDVGMLGLRGHERRNGKRGEQRDTERAKGHGRLRNKGVTQ